MLKLLNQTAKNCRVLFDIATECISAFSKIFCCENNNGQVEIHNECKELSIKKIPQYIENPNGVSFEIKFPRQGFENATLVDIARLAERFNMHSQSRAW